MATCGSFKQIFENPKPENPSSLIESLTSWNHIKSIKPVQVSSFTEIFGELHFIENRESSSSSSSSPRLPLLMDVNSKSKIEKLGDDELADSLLGTQQNQFMSSPKKGDGFTPKNSENLLHCTEGLGFESSDDVEESKNNEKKDDRKDLEKEKASVKKDISRDNLSELRKLRTRNLSFPPPISCIGRSGKPEVCFQSYRHDGRFILKEIRIPNQEFLHACRKDGRLRLQFVQPDEEIPEGEEEDDEEDHDDKRRNTNMEEKRENNCENGIY